MITCAVFCLTFYLPNRLQDYQGFQWGICPSFSKDNSKSRTKIMRSLLHLNYLFAICSLTSSCGWSDYFCQWRLLKHPWFFDETVSSKTMTTIAISNLNWENHHLLIVSVNRCHISMQRDVKIPTRVNDSIIPGNNCADWCCLHVHSKSPETMNQLQTIENNARSCPQNNEH